MILPTGAATFSEALQMGAEVYHNLKVACALPLLTVYALHRCW
jgi:enolase